MKFLFRTNANNEIGTGHVMRCLAFGQMLKDEGHEVTFLTQTKNQGLLNKLRKEDFSIIQFDEKPDLMKDAEITVEKSKELDIDWIITDNYKLTIYTSIENYGDLFDRKNDLNELNNLWYDDNFKEVRYDLINKMAQEILKAQSDYPHKQAIS